ncbi:hypothetical protein JKP88DRAFT_251006 [Tribonema minus]|uniref:Uncharacterized protein n=1 Tax=Tribonema minus TaxID=303371 RepID=A0A836CNU0_9STRA|nr:hypothetical protein JKP88DRAFT_251006 [Tribonema minus]
MDEWGRCYAYTFVYEMHAEDVSLGDLRDVIIDAITATEPTVRAEVTTTSVHPEDPAWRSITVGIKMAKRWSMSAHFKKVVKKIKGAIPESAAFQASDPSPVERDGIPGMFSAAIASDVQCRLAAAGAVVSAVVNAPVIVGATQEPQWSGYLVSIRYELKRAYSDDRISYPFLDNDQVAFCDVIETAALASRNVDKVAVVPTFYHRYDLQKGATVTSVAWTPSGDEEPHDPLTQKRLIEQFDFHVYAKTKKSATKDGLAAFVHNMDTALCFHEVPGFNRRIFGKYFITEDGLYDKGASVPWPVFTKTLVDPKTMRYIVASYPPLTARLELEKATLAAKALAIVPYQPPADSAAAVGAPAGVGNLQLSTGDEFAKLRVRLRLGDDERSTAQLEQELTRVRDANSRIRATIRSLSQEMAPRFKLLDDLLRVQQNTEAHIRLCDSTTDKSLEDDEAFKEIRKTAGEKVVRGVVDGATAAAVKAAFALAVQGGTDAAVAAMLAQYSDDTIAAVLKPAKDDS